MGIKKLENNYQIEHKMKSAAGYESEGKYLHAVQIYQLIIRENPEYLPAYLNLADTYEELGNIQPAIELINGRLEEEPENKEIRLYFGQFLIRNARWNEAIDILSYIFPEDEVTVSFFLGYSHFMLEEYEMAKVNFLRYLSNGEEAELLNETNLHLAKIEIELGDYKAALAYAKKAENIYSSFWELNYLIAKIYLLLDMYTHAVVPIERGIKLNPKEASTYELAGRIYLKAGDYQKAEKYFLKYIDMTEEASAYDYVNLADACLKSQKAQEALNYYDIAIKLDPENNYAREGKTRANSILSKSVVSDV